MAEIILLNRIRVDIGNVSGSLSELMQYAGMSGFNDNYEPQTKPRLVGTWTVNDWYTQEQLAQAQAAFDGLTIVEDPNYVIDFSQLAVQTLDDTQPNYNPAVAIILNNNNVGTLLPDAPISGKGRYFLSKTDAAAVTYINNWFESKTTVTDTNGIVSTDTTVSYNFEYFNEFQYFGVTSIVSTFFGCLNLKEIILPNTITTIGNSPGKNGTFCNCSSLYKLILNEGLIGIYSNGTYGDNNYNGMSAHRNTDIFNNCDSLVEITIPSTVTNLSLQGKMTSLKKINISNNSSLVVIGAMLWHRNIIEGITLPNTINQIRFRCLSGTIPYIHLLSTTPPSLYEDQDSRIGNTTIYVGDGSSPANDNAILADYLAVTSWANNSTKLDTWYNYLHPQS